MRCRAALGAALVVALAGCGTTATEAPTAPVTVPASPTPDTTSASPAPTAEATPASGAVQVLPPSSHVTGTAPTHCVAGADTGGHVLPDRACTPGSVRSDVTDATLTSTVCKAGWTGSVRPPLAETDRFKTKVMAAYGVTQPRGTTELDHFVPLALGGSNDASNLWPEPSDLPGKGIANSKDQVEIDLQHAVCQHRVTLDAARDAIVTDWATADQVLHLR